MIRKEKMPFKLRYLNNDPRFQQAFFFFFFTALKILGFKKIFQVLKFKVYHYHKKKCLPRKGNITACFS